MAKNTNKVKSLLFSIAISVGIGALSTLLTFKNFSTYSNMNQPPLSPSAWLFPVVWTILYVLMGVSAFLVYQSKKPTKSLALFVYGLQLFFNFFWSIIYFNFGQILFAFVWLVILWLLIIIMIVLFFRENKISAYLQIPYLLWVTFAGYLNLALYIVNI